MRDVILKRIRPLVERCAADLVDLALARIEAELERMGQALDVSASSYASDAPQDIHTAALGAQVASWMPPEPGRIVHRDDKPENLFPAKGITSDIPARAHVAESKSAADAPVPEAMPKRGAPRQDGNGGSLVREQRTTLTANGKRPPTCQACGFVGGNTRGCGRSHPTKTAASSTAPRSPAATPDRRAAIASLAKKMPTDRPHAARAEDDEIECWSSDRIATERASAEASKLDSELPRPRASFDVDHGAVTELAPEDELDFGAAAG